MPSGTICQLNYYGGGRLQYQDSYGKSSHLPFEKAPYLRVGQQVSFSIHHGPAGRDEAINVVPMNLSEATSLLPVMQTRKRKFALETESESLPSAAIRDEKQDFAVADLPESGSVPGRKIQQSIGRYHNADMEERQQLITRAEEGLDQLLEVAEIDGDALGKLVCRCVGWLHPPRIVEFGHAIGAEAESTRDASSRTEKSNLQLRLRRLLIRALKHLDLTDDGTRTVVEIALVYIQNLSKVVPQTQSGVATKVAKQWQALQSLVSTPPYRPPEKRQIVSRKGSATIAGGTYQPSQKVQKMPNVFTQNESISLTCSHCGHKISSSWFWQHPRTGIVHVLARANGHIVCTTKLGKKVPWIVDGDVMPLKNDHSGQLREDLGLQTQIRSHASIQMSGNLQKKGAILCLAFNIAKKCAFRVSRWMASRMFIGLFWFYDVLSVRQLLRNHCNFAQKNHSLRVSVTGLPHYWPKCFFSF